MNKISLAYIEKNPINFNHVNVSNLASRSKGIKFMHLYQMKDFHKEVSAKNNNKNSKTQNLYIFCLLPNSASTLITKLKPSINLKTIYDKK